MSNAAKIYIRATGTKPLRYVARKTGRAHDVAILGPLESARVFSSWVAAKSWANGLATVAGVKFEAEAHIEGPAQLVGTLNEFLALKRAKDLRKFGGLG